MRALTAYGDRSLARADSLYSIQELESAKIDYIRATLSLTSDPEHANARLNAIERQERFGLDHPGSRPYPRPSHPLCQAFQLAAGRNEIAEVRRLAIADPSVVSALDNRGNSPLHTAVDSNAMMVIEYLLGQSANVEAQDSSGQTPLHRARSPEAAHLLVRHGSSISARDHRGFTPLMSYAAAGWPSFEMQTALLNLGSDVNARAKDGSTAIILSAAAGNYSLDVIEALLNAGVDINATDNSGRSALDHARRFFRDDLAQFLIGKGAR